jgi:RNA ligase
MIEILKKYLEEGLIQKQTHSTLPLIIWNYTPKTQYDRLWDDITLLTRGLVTDINGKIIARPFKKFFNWDEYKHTPTAEFEVYEKLDGSLGILFNYDNNWIFATRGSFTSEQAIKGFALLQKYDYNSLNKNLTYLFEIIYPENRIVCEYSYEDIVLLGIIDTDTGYEINLYDENIDNHYKNLVQTIGFKIAKKYDGIKDYTELKSIIGNNQEGFVVKFSNGDRIKIKGDEYIRLHKLMTNISTRNIWKILSENGNILEILNNVPDEFYDKIKKYSNDLLSEFGILETYYLTVFKNIKEVLDKEINISDERKYRATFSKYAKKYEYPSILYKMLDNKNYKQLIWNLIEPKFKKL